MSPDQIEQLRQLAKEAHQASGADADAILAASDLAEEYCSVALHLLSQGDQVIAPELLYRAGQIDHHFAAVHSLFFGSDLDGGS